MLKLEKEQEDLLSSLVEAARTTPRENRSDFIAVRTMKDPSIRHTGLPGGKKVIYWGDLNILDQEGLLAISDRKPGILIFDIGPRGFEYYNWMKNRDDQPIKTVDNEIIKYLDEGNFKQMYPDAYEKWRDSASRLWSSESTEQLTVIGHLCRESMQEFVTALVELYAPEDVDPDLAHTKNRLKNVLKINIARLGDTERKFLDALIQYWDALNEIVQRQEHGNQKLGSQLLWEDGRRLVFQTAVVMFEIDRSLLRNHGLR